jgi:hypothetical protein
LDTCAENEILKSGNMQKLQLLTKVENTSSIILLTFLEYTFLEFRRVNHTTMLKTNVNKSGYLFQFFSQELFQLLVFIHFIEF